MAWSANNRACTTVWSTLMALNQIDESTTFKTAGDLKIGALAFYPHDSAIEVVNLRANAMALQLDKIFRLVRGAKYEDSVQQSDVGVALASVLTNKEKIIADLAEVADQKYRFFKEEA